MKGSRGGSWGDGVSPAPLGVEGKCGQSSAEWWEGHRLPCSRPARYALWAICDVLPPHFPVLRFACPRFQPRSGVSASFAEKRGVMGAGRCGGGSVSGLGQAGGRPSKGLRDAARGVKWEGHRLACPKLRPRSGVSASSQKHGGDGRGASWWRERFRLGSSRRLTLRGSARGGNQPGLEFVLQTGWLNGTI
jgi:hypothetical protein